MTYKTYHILCTIQFFFTVGILSTLLVGLVNHWGPKFYAGIVMASIINMIGRLVIRRLYCHLNKSDFMCKDII